MKFKTPSLRLTMQCDTGIEKVYSNEIKSKTFQHSPNVLTISQPHLFILV